jgi:uncharacterized protein YyaL (SSP411 family)
VPNRLAASTSPYLLQHAGNPVDWQEWGDDAFAEARRRDVPVLLSVGYAACHWCHVMAHESFEDRATAEQMNAGFVCVKVDREERPDVDAVYMEATQALTGHGGWPMTVFLTPEGKPVFGGTYFPPVPGRGLPSFRDVLSAISAAWEERREEVLDAGARIAAELARRTGFEGERPIDADGLAAAVATLERGFDEDRGGFGGAPKFPPSMVLEWLLRHAARVSSGPDPGSADAALPMAGTTLRAMAFSGMYDQLEGGFARYSVDAAWVVPHFEKMLYDNGLLARAYLHWWRLTGDPLGRRIALETCDWMLARLGTAQGGLAASMDADTPAADGGAGVEGETYVWTPAQLNEVLGEADGEWVADLCGVTVVGTFEEGASTLRMLLDLDALPAADRERWARCRELLMRARSERRQPARDDKVVAAWNGLAIAALAETGGLAGRPDLVEAAGRIADLLLDLHVVGGQLRRVSRAGRVGTPSGVLEDYADLVEGLLALYAVTGAHRWYVSAAGLVDSMVDRFWDDAAEGFRDTASDAVDLPLAAALGGRGRLHDPTDGATPSGTSAAAGALLAFSALSGSTRHRRLAEAALAQGARLAAQEPRMAGWYLAVSEALVDGPREVAVVGAAGDPRRTALHQVALAGTAPGLVLAVGAADPAPDAPPLLADRPLVEGGPAAYPCRGMVCDLPVTLPAALAAWVGSRLLTANGLDVSE